MGRCAAFQWWALSLAVGGCFGAVAATFHAAPAAALPAGAVDECSGAGFVGAPAQQVLVWAGVQVEAVCGEYGQDGIEVAIAVKPVLVKS